MKSKDELCRNCVRWVRNRRRTLRFTASHQRGSSRRNSLNRVREGACRCRSVSLAGIVFQACSFNHSDISPALESTVYEQPYRDYRTRRRFRSRSSISFALSRLTPTRTAARGNCVRPRNVPRSLTAISLSCLWAFVTDLQLGKSQPPRCPTGLPRNHRCRWPR